MCRYFGIPRQNFWDFCSEISEFGTFSQKFWDFCSKILGLFFKITWDFFSHILGLCVHISRVPPFNMEILKRGTFPEDIRWYRPGASCLNLKLLTQDWVEVEKANWIVFQPWSKNSFLAVFQRAGKFAQTKRDVIRQLGDAPSTGMHGLFLLPTSPEIWPIGPFWALKWSLGLWGPVSWIWISSSVGSCKKVLA